MDTILIVGVDSVVGANLALECVGRGNVIGISHGTPPCLAGCEHLLDPVRPGVSEATARQEVESLLAEYNPGQMVLCGPASESSWDPATKSRLSAETIQHVRIWSTAAGKQDVPCTLISSDAVFTGPWMFHEEDCSGVCDSPAAVLVREQEQVVREACPASLIVRTNAFGWSPFGERGWLERELATIARNRLTDLDSIRHGTPILASDLAKILLRAWDDRLSGVFHIAGAERINPQKFFQRLADRFELPWLTLRHTTTLDGRPRGFGEGECSLQTKKIRKALCLAMPILSESLDGLVAQAYNGHRERLGVETPLGMDLVTPAAA